MERVGGSLLVIFFIIWLIVKVIIWTIKLLLIAISISLGLALILLIPATIIWLFIKTLKAFKQNKFELKRTIILPILTVLTGIVISFGVQLGFSNAAVIFALMVGGIPLTTLLLYPPINHRKLIRKYRDGEQYLINP